MNQERPFDIADLDVRTREAIQELRETISARYLTTTFEFARAADDPSFGHPPGPTESDCSGAAQP